MVLQDGRDSVDVIFDVKANKMCPNHSSPGVCSNTFKQELPRETALKVKTEQSTQKERNSNKEVKSDLSFQNRNQLVI